MRGVVDRSVIEEDEVLVRGTSAYIEARAGFSHGSNAGQREYGPQDIRFTQDGRDLLDRLDADAFNPHLKGLDIRSFFRHDRSRDQAGNEFLHFNVQFSIGVEHDLPLGVFHASAADLQYMSSTGKGQREIAVGIRDRADGRMLDIDSGADEGLAIADIPYVAYQRGIPGSQVIGRDAD